MYRFWEWLVIRGLLDKHRSKQDEYKEAIQDLDEWKNTLKGLLYTKNTGIITKKLEYGKKEVEQGM